MYVCVYLLRFSSFPLPNPLRQLPLDSVHRSRRKGERSQQASIKSSEEPPHHNLSHHHHKLSNYTRWQSRLPLPRGRTRHGKESEGRQSQSKQRHVTGRHTGKKEEGEAVRQRETCDPHGGKEWWKYQHGEKKQEVSREHNQETQHN